MSEKHPVCWNRWVKRGAKRGEGRSLWDEINTAELRRV